MDIPLGAVFMASLCLSLTDGDSNYGKAFGVSLLSAMLVMIKPSGIIFVVTACAVYMVNEYISKDFRLTFGNIRRLLCVGGVLSISVPLIELGIWNVMMKYLGRVGGDQFSLKGFLPGNVVAKYQSDIVYAKSFHAMIRNFWDAFINRGVTVKQSKNAFLKQIIMTQGICLIYGYLMLTKRKFLMTFRRFS